MKICLVSLVQTCSACPSQWEGYTDDDRQVYIRYRCGYLSVRIGNQHDHEEYAAVDGDEILGISIGDNFDGFISEKELRELAGSVLDFDSIQEHV